MTHYAIHHAIADLVIFVANAKCFAHSKVADLGVTLVDKQYIAGSEIAVYEVLPFEICHTDRYLMHQQ